MRAGPGGCSRADLNVRAIVVAADNRDTLYVGTEREGVWRSTDRGVVWDPRNTRAHEPEHPGAAGSTRDACDVVRRVGRRRHVPLARRQRKMGRCRQWAPGARTSTRCWSTARNPQRVFAGTNGGGLFRSTTGGDAWEDVSEGLVSLAVTSVALDGSTPSAVYVGTAEAGLFKGSGAAGEWKR